MVEWEEAALDKLVESFKEISYARTSPQVELFIVEGWQFRGLAIW